MDSKDGEVVPHLSMIFPSRRPVQLASCLAQLLTTTATYDVEIVVVADTPEVAAVAETCADLVVTSEPVKAIDAWNIGASHASGAWFFLGADDLWFTDGWLAALWPYLIPAYGVVGVDDGMDSMGRMGWASHFATSREFCTRHMGGVMVPPVYHHYYCDVEVCRKAQAAGLFVYAQDALVEHRHWEWKLSEFDAVYANACTGLDGDRSLFARRTAQGFPVTWEPMIYA